MSAYQKKYMSITELVECGFSRKTLNDWAHAKGAPVIRTTGGGKMLFDTTMIDEFAREMTERSKKQ